MVNFKWADLIFMVFSCQFLRNACISMNQINAILIYSLTLCSDMNDKFRKSGVAPESSEDFVQQNSWGKNTRSDAQPQL